MPATAAAGGGGIVGDDVMRQKVLQLNFYRNNIAIRSYGVHNNANWCCAPGNENLEDDRVIFLVICNDLQCATNPQSQTFSNRERMLAPLIGRNLT